MAPTMSDKLVVEDWSRYNAAVLARARGSRWQRWAIASGIVALVAIAAAHVWWELSHPRRAAVVTPQAHAAGVPTPTLSPTAPEPTKRLDAEPRPTAPAQPAVPSHPEFGPARPPERTPPSPFSADPPAASSPAESQVRPPPAMPEAVRQPQPQQTQAGDPVVTDFTLFKHVEFKGGTVVTGWKFGSSKEQAPYQQYCYFSLAQQGKEALVEVEDRPGLRFPRPDLLASEWTAADWDEAATKCVWFGGEMAPAPTRPPQSRPPSDQSGVPRAAPPPPPRSPAAPSHPKDPASAPAPEAPPVTQDQLAELLHALGNGGVPSLPGADPAAAAAMIEGLRDRAAWETFFNALPDGDARAGALFWAAERSLRTPRDCASQATSNAFLIACNQARALLSPFDQRRKAEPAYRNGWNSFRSSDAGNPAPAAPDPQAATSPFGESDRIARDFVGRLAQALSGSLQQMDAFYARAYAPSVDFYGAAKSAEFVFNAKHDYAVRWPVRSYTVRPDSLLVMCESERCTVKGVADWDYASPDRHAHSTGAASFALGLTIQDGAARITSESGAVIERNPG